MGICFHSYIITINMINKTMNKPCLYVLLESFSRFRISSGRFTGICWFSQCSSEFFIEKFCIFSQTCNWASMCHWQMQFFVRKCKLRKLLWISAVNFFIVFDLLWNFCGICEILSYFIFIVLFTEDSEKQS